MALHELLFLNPVLYNGINVTVRKGDKWFEKATVGDQLAIFKTGEEAERCNMRGEGDVIGLALLPCNMIPVELLVLEHDPLCRNQYGLSQAMLRAYPDFKPDDLVTILIFNLKQGEQK